MILQKLASALRRQDWFQVVIEVMIVIVGIFLGLQVQAWYEEREDKVIEQRFIGYLISDIENTISYTERMGDFYQQRIDTGTNALELLDQETLQSEDQQAFEFGIQQLDQNNELDNYLNTFLVGNLDQILDPTMRRTVDNFIAVLNTSRNIMQLSRNNARVSTDLINTKISIVQRDNTSNLTFYNFEDLRNDNEFRIAVASSIGILISYQNRTARINQYSNTLLPILMNYQSGKKVEVENFR